MKTTSDTWTFSTTNTQSEAYVITSVNPVEGGFTIQGARGLFGTDDTTAGSAVYANKKQNNNGVWTISEGAVVTMSIGDAHYSTFIAPFDVEIPEGVTATKITGVDVTTLTEEVVEDIIPANIPVVLYSENTVSETFSGANTATEDSYKVGLLTGVYSATPAPVGSYVLQNHDGKVAFYQVNETKPTVKANRAYLTVDSNVKAFYFGENTDAIQSIEAESEQGAIYNLAGQRVSKATKGIFIKNGRKVVIK
jgi:hypothetical protein